METSWEREGEAPAPPSRPTARRPWARPAALGALLLAAGFCIGALVGSMARRSPAAASPASARPLAAVDQAYALIVKDYAGTVSSRSLVDGALSGMAQALGDPFSQYMPPGAATAFAGSLSGYGGIGVTVASTPAGPVVQAVVSGGPAAHAGLRAGDRIVAVDGRPTLGVSLPQLAALVRGTPGTRVELAALRPGARRPARYVMTRSIMLAPSVFATMPRPGVGMLRIASFTADTGAEFDRLYARLRKQAGPGGLRGLVIDLRDDGGGYVSAAAHIAAELAPPGPLFRLVEPSGRTIVYRAHPHAPVPPIVVLVNGGTASAAEILAGSLQYARVAVLVGSRTYGKGSVQELFDLPGGGGLKLTVAHDELPDGVSWNHVGLHPDVLAQPAPPAWSQVPTFDPLGDRPLSLGMVGLDVQGLQQRLAFLGYHPGAENGLYGAGTAAAVRAFQAAEHLRPTGAVSAGDWSALAQAMGDKVRRLQAAPAPDTVLLKGLQVLQRLVAERAHP